MKNFKKVCSFITMSAIIGSFTVAPIFANTVDGKDEQTSNAKVEFARDTTAPIGPVNPVDPTDPTKPGTGGTGSEGDFTIDYVPELDFGKIELKGSDSKITKKSISKKPYVQVSDRRLTGEGWQLQAKMSDFIHANGENTISGAKITMKNGEVKKVNSSSVAPTVASPVIIDKESKTVMSASKNSGLGTWLATWMSGDATNENENVELEIPTTDAIVGDYNAEITWTLIKQP